MLLLRPSCEHCNKSLPPDSSEAMICSYECTYCKQCVTDVLENVCPNCGGGFHPRPVRPKNNLKNNSYLGQNPASTKIVHRPVEINAHRKFAQTIKSIAPDKR